MLEPRMKYIDGQGARLSYEIACQHCRRGFIVPAIQHLKGTRGNDGMDARNRTNIERAMSAAGWTWKGDFRRVTCPNCKPGPAAAPAGNVVPIATARDRAEALFAPRCEPVMEIPNPEENTMSQKTAPAVTPTPAPEADDPSQRRPTLDQRRAIADALDTAYDARRGLYLKDGSDRRLADMLKLPRAWVTEIRVMLYGEHDRNEAAEKTIREVEGLTARLDAIDKKLERAIDEAMAETQKVRAAIEDALTKLRGGRP